MSVLTWIITTGPSIAGLAGLVQPVAEPLQVVVVAPREVAEKVAAAGLDVCWVATDEKTPPEAAAKTVAALAAEKKPGLVAAGPSPATRVLLAAAVTALGGEVLTGVEQISPTDDGVTVSRTGLGGILATRETWSGPVAVIADTGGATVATDQPGHIQPASLDALPITLGQRRVEKAHHVDLSAAKRIVAIGRGLKSQDDLKLVNELATVLGAEVACSRPLAEGLGWLPKDRYVGVSGAHVAPDLYLALGVSGQLQHTVGMSGSRCVVAVNSDKDAPIFQSCDYGIVADLYKVLPALISAVKEASDG